MSYPPDKMTKSGQIRERYRKLRRQQRASFAAVALMVIVCVVIIAGIIFVVRSCTANRTIISQARYRQVGETGRLAAVAGRLDFKVAPWYLALGDSHLFTGSDLAVRDTEYSGHFVDSLAGYSVGDAEPDWQTSVDYNFNDMVVAEESLVGMRQYMHHPPRLEITSFGIADGNPGWSVVIENAMNGSMVVDGRIVIIGYQPDDDFRLAGYNSQTGVKVWGMKLPLAGLISDYEYGGGSIHLDLDVNQGLATYRINNVLGIVETQTGKRVRESFVLGDLANLALDPSSSTCYVVFEDLQPAEYMLAALAYPTGTPKELLSFNSDDAGGLLFANDGYAVLAYSSTDEGNLESTAHLCCFARDNPSPIVTHAFPTGQIVDIAPIPSETGEFLVALNDDRAQLLQPKGWGALSRVSCENQSVVAVSRFNRNVQLLAPFKKDCLVLLYGGAVMDYIADISKSVQLTKAAYPWLGTVYSPGGRKVAVTSYPTAYLEGRSGARMQVIIFE